MDDTSAAKAEQERIAQVVAQATANAKAKHARLRKLKESNERVMNERKEDLEDDVDDYVERTREL